jgi:hypothetical protein
MDRNFKSKIVGSQRVFYAYKGDQNTFKASILKLEVTGDGKYILSGSGKIGDKVKFGGGFADDGKYTLANDNSIVTIKSGVITDIIPGRQL